MWKSISRVPKVVEENKNKKNLEAAGDSMEYEKNTGRTGQGRFWRNGKLVGCGYSMIMIKEWYASGALNESKQTMVVQNVLNSTRFINSCSSQNVQRDGGGGGGLLGKWKLIQASAFRGLLARMASAIKIKCPTLWLHCFKISIMFHIWGMY